MAKRVIVDPVNTAQSFELSTKPESLASSTPAEIHQPPIRFIRRDRVVAPVPAGPAPIKLPSCVSGADKTQGLSNDIHPNPSGSDSPMKALTCPEVLDYDTYFEYLMG